MRHLVWPALFALTGAIAWQAHTLSSIQQQLDALQRAPVPEDVVPRGTRTAPSAPRPVASPAAVSDEALEAAAAKAIEQAEQSRFEARIAQHEEQVSAHIAAEIGGLVGDGVLSADQVEPASDVLVAHLHELWILQREAAEGLVGAELFAEESEAILSEAAAALADTVGDRAAQEILQRTLYATP